MRRLPFIWSLEINPKPQPPPPLQLHDQVMKKYQQQHNYQSIGGGEMYMKKVMTDEQMELLRHQISIYTALSERLVDLHKAISAQQDGVRLGSQYRDPLMTSAGYKITTRQRWTPTPLQLQRLELLFDQGNVTPSKHKIKEITDQLMKHGQISETNVHHWFQNRRARSKRKQSVSATNNGESAEVRTEVESPSREKNTNPENIQSLEALSAGVDNIFFQKNSDIGNDVFHFRHGSTSSDDLDLFSIYDDQLMNPGFDQFISQTEVPGNLSHFWFDEDYEMIP